MARVVVDRRLVRNFTRRALKRYPLEYIESIFGRVKGDAIYIHAFYPLNHTASRHAVAYGEGELENAEELAEEERLQWLGTIHSHPDMMAVPSQTDLLSAANDKETVMGVCSIEKQGRTKIRVLFWPVIVPLGIEYR